MRHTYRSRQPAALCVVAALAVSGSAAGGAAAAAPPPPVPAATAATAATAPSTAAPTAAGGGSAGARTVTLVTGDKVTLTTGPGGKKGVSVHPAPGREKIGFAQQTLGDTITVTPSDALDLVNKGSLDRRLFDVTGLIAMGYDDASRPTMPLIVRSPVGSADSGARPSFTAATSVVQLPSIASQAVAESKAHAKDFWTSVTGPRDAAPGQPRALAAGVSHVWLDGRVTAALDRSVPQIGAPEAWQAGLTGQGVRTAVLDTGIDETHPDLADAVAEAKDFTNSPDGLHDDVGHGTHVASIITGSGAASSGKYKGVAPDTTLLVGKVLNEKGGSDSQVIAGMQWAVDEGARVVNMSLGARGPGAATDGTDPLAQAVDQLSDASGALFVIAAGNVGAAESVSTPGSADRALTVGAVDDDDQLAGFSSRGPRVGDHAVKPEITAPGVGIVAARAAGSTLGPVVDDQYMQLDGTSMATPHVAGAAAILAQQHPDWKAPQLKAALISAAEPTPGLNVFEQGTGRVDVARAVQQQAYASPGAVSTELPFGYVTPVTRTVTYHNDGDAPLTLDLALDLTDEQGAPVTAVSLDHGSSVTVPAGGTAEVPLTIGTPHVGPGTTYGGTLTATGPDGTVIRTAVAVHAKPEVYPVSLDVIDRDGQHVESPSFGLINVDTAQPVPLHVSGGKLVGEAPPGDYTLAVLSFTSGTTTLISQEAIVGPGGVSLTADARAGVPVETHVDRPAAQMAAQGVGLAEKIGAGHDVQLEVADTDPSTMYAVPTDEPVTTRPFSFLHDAFMTEPLGQTATVHAYNLAFAVEKRIPEHPVFSVTDQQLATVHARFHASGTDGLRNNLASYRDFPSFGYFYDVKVPGETVEYFTPGPDFSWPFRALGTDSLFGGGLPKKYSAGQTYTEDWNKAVFGPWIQAYRCGDGYLFNPFPVSPSGTGNVGGTFPADTAGTMTLLRDGTEIASDGTNALFQGFFGEGLPPGSATYTLKMSHSHTAPSFPLATRSDVEWTYQSARPEGQPEVCGIGTPNQSVPLLNLKADGDFNLANQAPAGTPFRLTVNGEHFDTATPVALRDLTVQASFDDGGTWSEASVTGDAQGVFTATVPPAPAGEAGSGYVSLRMTAHDDAGNGVKQEVIRAYALAP